MKSNEIDHQINEICADFIDVCPHCKSKAHLVLVSNKHHMADNRNQFNYVLFRCKPCKKLSLRVFCSVQNKHSREQDLTPSEWVAKFPLNSSSPAKKFTSCVPPAIVEDYAEGLTCLENDAHKAAVSMFRRAIQTAMINLGANQEKDLIDQIKTVRSLTQDIKDWGAQYSYIWQLGRPSTR